MLLYHVFLQGTRDVKYVMLRNSDSVGSFIRVIMLKVKHQPATEGCKERGLNQLLASFLKMAVLWIRVFNVQAMATSGTLKYIYIINNFCFSLGLRL